MNTPTPPNPAASPESPLAISVQYVKDFSFENPNAPQSLTDMAQSPSITVDMNVDANQLGERQFEVLLRLGAKAEKDSRTIFEVELVYAGICQVNAIVPQEQISPLVMIEAPRMLFPFARGIIANATRDGGFPPLLLNPVNFVALYQQMAAQQAAQREAQAGQAGGADNAI
ncbi:MAG: protein-export chaperone SecB [Alphaproteobacteria bacterium]|nr:protein-export chaperone SecB [Alphaproteobacteria bacterium]MCB9927945.1 protein-export chaperone SecB [Alphaproteobacteria bacterium]